MHPGIWVRREADMEIADIRADAGLALALQQMLRSIEHDKASHATPDLFKDGDQAAPHISDGPSTQPANSVGGIPGPSASTSPRSAPPNRG